MKLSRYGLPVVAALIACCFATVSWAALAVTGDFQDEAGFGGDWTPAAAPLMNDLTGGFFDLSLTGLAPKTRYQFKILDDEGTSPPAFGDPEVPDNGPGSPNVWFVSNGAGEVTLNLDRNGDPNDGFQRADDRITASTDSDPNVFVGFFATGNWESELGGSDFSGNDPNFALSNAGGNLWTIDFSVPVTGTYEIKATGDIGSGGDFAYQWGTNGRLSDSANLAFSVTDPNQVFTFSLDLDKGAIAIDSGGFLPGDTNNDGVVDLVNDFTPIQDNWFNQTFLRSEGNLDNEGTSEGIVDITDFRQWKQAYAATLPLSGGLSAAVTAVPEPSTLGLALMIGIGMLGRARRRAC